MIQPLPQSCHEGCNCINISDSITHVFILSRLFFTLHSCQPACCNLSVGKDILGMIPCLFSVSQDNVLHVMDPARRISPFLCSNDTKKRMQLSVSRSYGFLSDHPVHSTEHFPQCLLCPQSPLKCSAEPVEPQMGAAGQQGRCTDTLALLCTGTCVCLCALGPCFVTWQRHSWVTLCLTDEILWS